MIEDLGGVTSQLVKLALNAAMQNHKVISNNIANANTPGFTAKKLDFENMISGYVNRLLDYENDSFSKKEIDNLSISLANGDAIQDAEEDEVKVDIEMIRLTENVLRYQALIEASGKKGSILKMAISGGRG